jgi:lysozyme family protein
MWVGHQPDDDFAIATVLGVIAGSFAWSLATRSFRWEGFAGFEDTACHCSAPH